MMAKDLLSAGDLSEGYDEEDGKKKGDSEESDEEDDQDLAELGAKYAERFATAIDDKDWSAAYGAFCKMCELHKYEEDQERGY